MKYYPFSKKWSIIKPHLDNQEVKRILVEDFNKFTYGRWGREFTEGMLPKQFETCDWDIDHRGRRPQYWSYVKHAACHWLVNFNLTLAQLVEPKKEWRIVTSQDHSTVWDGKDTLFDMNFSAIGVDPDDAFNLANKKVLPIGKRLVVHKAEKVK
jgi:hypothetical protein